MLAPVRASNRKRSTLPLVVERLNTLQRVCSSEGARRQSGFGYLVTREAVDSLSGFRAGQTERNAGPLGVARVSMEVAARMGDHPVDEPESETVRV